MFGLSVGLCILSGITMLGALIAFVVDLDSYKHQVSIIASYVFLIALSFFIYCVNNMRDYEELQNEHTALLTEFRELETENFKLAFPKVDSVCVSPSTSDTVNVDGKQMVITIQQID